ncbi:TRAP transporter small permease [Alkalilimnicola sp. S0819]|uniref:TRAP transporter small permease n=1 Tax=Alkalilimnicola sp. S0819 TaxID=2613922 RepID=UPI00126192DC|nr:TRAP transporter small permease [Alkalilimnicola sp. S0819]KAB7623335.1 TRAP transporter small permease [Alkalilimnicola sp. S0819]MPQ16874.1 TRAP transporter small permease subunit [Alkalilimnicola sp. S0819]
MSTSRLLRSMERWFTGLINALLAVLAFVAIAINVANAVGRSFFGSALPWAEETLAYGMIWAVFLGAAVLMLRDEHIRIDLAATLLPERLARGLRALLLVAGGVICGYVALQSWEVVDSALRSGRRSVVVGMPMSLAHGAVLVGFILMAVLAVLRGGLDLWRVLRNTGAVE